MTEHERRLRDLLAEATKHLDVSDCCRALRERIIEALKAPHGCDCTRQHPHMHCPECGSVEHRAYDCDAEDKP